MRGGHETSHSPPVRRMGLGRLFASVRQCSMLARIAGVRLFGSTSFGTPRSVAPLAAALVLAGLGAPLAHGDAPLTLTYETRVTLDLRLTLTGPGAEPRWAAETLRGAPGEALAFAHDFLLEGEPLVAALTIVPQPRESDGSCQLLIDAMVRRGQEPAVAFTRDARVASSSLLLSELWFDDRSERRIVLAVAANWERIPHLTTLHPGGEPVDLTLEVLEWSAGSYRSLELNRLASIVGESVSYTFARGGGPTGAGGNERLVVTLLPESIHEGEVYLRVRIQQERAVGTQAPSTVETALGERLAPGMALDVPLPGPSGQPGLVFRVKPYF